MWPYLKRFVDERLFCLRVFFIKTINIIRMRNTICTYVSHYWNSIIFVCYSLAFIDRGSLKYASRFAFEVIKCSGKLFISGLTHGSFWNTSKHKILIRIFHHVKCNALRNLGNKIGLRQKLHKTILFSHV